jgi:hypothetical protein
VVVHVPTPGSMIRVRSSTWKVLGHERRSDGNIVTCKGTAGVVKDKSARFVLELENDYKILNPAAVNLVRDTSSYLALLR